jgi:hypothetical protein
VERAGAFMPGEGAEWNSLEIVRLLVEFGTPVAIVLIGFYIQRQVSRLDLSIQRELKELDQTLWANQTVIQERIALYRTIGPLLNDVYCYFMWIGKWKEISPLQVIEKKRELDRQMYVYRFLFSPELFEAYRAFIRSCFEENASVNADATLLTALVSHDNDLRRESYLASMPSSVSASAEWPESWNRRFKYQVEPQGRSPRDDVRRTYHSLTHAFSQDVGLGSRNAA